MTSIFVVRDLFKLAGDVTVLACEGESDLSSFVGRTGQLTNGGELLQSIRLSGERRMLNQARPKSFRAFETLENVRLSVDEAQSGTWVLTLAD